MNRMYRTDLYFEDDIFDIEVDVIKREEGITIYWSTVYGKKTERLYCIKIDDKPLMMTNSTIINLDFEKAVLNCINRIEYTNADNGPGKLLQHC
ncbi:MAG: hypothetical protein BGP13_07705 [Sphingobacteriales bacterium 40-81]|nr:MAG: hypothetical protein BGP13_07705 [Sphingobacteriales bacterium 40-81]